MTPKKTHRLVEKPKMSARHLADYMAATDQRRRTILRACKYQPIARVVQHDEAKLAISGFMCGNGDLDTLTEKAFELRDRMADSDFERDVLDHNADYIDSFVAAHPDLVLPDADVLPPGTAPKISLNGVKVAPEIHFRLRRLTKTNKIRVGAGMLRYAKGKALPSATGEWQSAFLHGYIGSVGVEHGAEPEKKLCVTLDAYSGESYPAPTNSVKRFNEMEAACHTIAELWPNIPPPPNAEF